MKMVWADLSPAIYYAHMYKMRDGERLLQRPALESAYCLWHQLEGTATVSYHDQELLARPGQVFLTQPGTSVTVQPGLRSMIVAFDLFYRPRDCDGRSLLIASGTDPQPALAEAFGQAVPLLLPEAQTGTAQNLIAHITDRYWQSETDYMICCGRLLSFMAELRLSGSDQQAPELPEDAIVRQANEIMLARFQAGCTVADVAKSLGFSRQYFSDVYRRRCGFTPGAYLDRLQIERACRLLMDSDATIADIASACGLRSPAALTNRFRKIFQTSPAQWRRQQKQLGA